MGHGVLDAQPVMSAHAMRRLWSKGLLAAALAAGGACGEPSMVGADGVCKEDGQCSAGSRCLFGTCVPPADEGSTWAVEILPGPATGASDDPAMVPARVTEIEAWHSGEGAQLTAVPTTTLSVDHRLSPHRGPAAPQGQRPLDGAAGDPGPPGPDLRDERLARGAERAAVGPRRRRPTERPVGAHPVADRGGIPALFLRRHPRQRSPESNGRQQRLASWPGAKRRRRGLPGRSIRGPGVPG